MDTAGLGSDRIADLAVRRALPPEAIAQVAHDEGAMVAVATQSWLADHRPPGWVPVVDVEWGLDADRRIEPLVLYALAPEGADTARRWAEAAVRGTGGRATVVAAAP